MKNLKCKLIHVEDNEDDARVFRNVLKRSGVNIQIEHLWDGKSAFDLLDNDAVFDGKTGILVVLDLNLPFMTGSEILKELHGSHKIEKIPIIVLSGSENPEDKKLCLSLGAKDFFIKPWDLDGYKAFIEGRFIKELQKVCPEFKRLG